MKLSKISWENRYFQTVGATYVNETFLYNHCHFSHLTFIEKLLSRQCKTLPGNFTDEKNLTTIQGHKNKSIKISPLGPLK